MEGRSESGRRYNEVSRKLEISLFLMKIELSKSDIIWSYLAQFFNIGAGFITLPLVLHMLSTEEIAMNYMMLTVGSMVALIDFGFAPQFGRNITYVFSGAQTLKKQGLSNEVGEKINYHLLKCLIDVAKSVYQIMSLIVLAIMLTFGTWYIYCVTEGFTTVHNSLLIWLAYSISVYFNIYFYYYSSLLTGRGKIMESKKAMMASKISYILLSYILLLCGLGLIGLCIANLVSPFISRWMQYYWFYDTDLKTNLNREISTKKEKIELFKIIWHNAKKLGLNFIGSYAISKFSMFIIGLFLVSKEVSSYGLMTQLVGIISGVSGVLFTSLLPSLANSRVDNDKTRLLNEFAGAMNLFYFIFILGSLILVLFGTPALNLIKSNAELPTLTILSMYLLVSLLEGNHSNFASFITTNNEIPFVKAALLSGFSICVLDYIVLKYTNLGLWGIVLVQGIVQLAYNNWYWPMKVCKELNISFATFLKTGIKVNSLKLIRVIQKER